jgi:CubicO group peptidase (beta-lactamase class C family)
MRLLRYATMTVLALAATTSAFAQGRTRAEKIAIMDSIANSPVVEGRVAGLTVAIVQRNDTLLFKGYGKADLEWNIPMPVDAQFEIGSVTKQFTSAAILQLRDAGKLDLDADLTKYLPNYPTKGHKITVRRLLDHTSGIKGATEMKAFDEIRMRNLPRDTLLKLIAAEPFDFAPGEAMIYNNSAYIILGHIIEKVSGMSYEDYIEKNFFTRLGMNRSAYCSNTDVVPRRARGYQLQVQQRVLAKAETNNHLWPFSAGSLCSTAGDLITWLKALHGGKALPPASYKDLITPGRLNDGTSLRYAMGIGLTPDVRGRKTISHGGGIAGFVSDTRYYPDEDLYVVVLVNTTGNLSPGALALEMVDVLLPWRDVATKPFEGDATPLVGTYSGPARGRNITVKITSTGNGIAASVNDARATPLMWFEGLTFGSTSQRLTFVRSGNGPATVLQVDAGGGLYVLRRQPD